MSKHDENAHEDGAKILIEVKGNEVKTQISGCSCGLLRACLGLLNALEHDGRLQEIFSTALDASSNVVEIRTPEDFLRVLSKEVGLKGKDRGEEGDFFTDIGAKYKVKPEDAEHRTIEAMSKYGGTFVKELAELYRRADGNNEQKLISSFRDYFEDYAKKALGD